MDAGLPQRERITIAILALGGEGGGVLADWIRQLARDNGYVVQATSVPGVAQRTGSTVYYLELVRAAGAGDNRPDPVLAMMPTPGDVDIVIASELMEAGRAILRGFVTQDRTTLIGSTHRVYAVSEKAAPGDGIAAGERILAAARTRARRFVGFDMGDAARAAESPLSAVMFGALAGAEVLPFARPAFEAAIRAGGKAVAANLAGFALGAERVATGDPAAAPPPAPPEPTTAAGRALAARIAAELPPAAQPTALEGARRLIEYQDRAYADLYLDRLAPFASDPALATAAARHLALWMAYEDTIRVADLKVRAARRERIAGEVRLAPGQLMTVTDYMHPRLREVAETLPAPLGRAVLGPLRGLVEPFFRRGRHVRVTSLRWSVALRLVAGLRRIRRTTLRYRDETARIEAWLGEARALAATDPAAAAELLACQELLKGYSNTYERGLARFAAVTAAARAAGPAPGLAARFAALRAAALADETGVALERALAERGTAA